MKVYLNSVCYPIVWKTQMRKNMWYNMEPAKIKITMPLSVYEDILSDWRKGNSDLSFDISKLESEDIKCGFTKYKNESGLWNIEACIYSMSTSSRFKDGTCIAILDIGVCSSKHQDKSILRNYLLNELV